MDALKFSQIRIENTNACGYRCKVCPREKLTRKIGIMSLDDFSLVLDKLPPFKGIFHLHGFGEPLLDKVLPDKVTLLKQKFPSSKAQIISTLGVNVKDDYFIKLAKADLDDIMISHYGYTKKAYKTAHGYDGYNLVKRNLKLLSDVLNTSYFSLSGFVKVYINSTSFSKPLDPKKALKFIKWIDSLGFHIIEGADPHNYGDGRNFNKPKDEKICPVISGKRKNILHITWDLNVVPCCFDYNSSIVFGNLRTNTLDEIFSSFEYLKFLKAHRTKDLSKYPICQNCEKNDLF